MLSPFKVWISSWAFKLKNNFDNWSKRVLFFFICLTQIRYQQSRQKMGEFLGNKTFKNQSYQKYYTRQIFSKEYNFIDFQPWKMTLKIWILLSLRSVNNVFRKFEKKVKLHIWSVVNMDAKPENQKLNWL